MSRYYTRRVDPAYNFSKLMCKLLAHNSIVVGNQELYIMRNTKNKVWISKRWITEC